MTNLVQISEEEVMVLAKEIYESEIRNEYMPPFEDAPSIYARGCINDAAVRLGWKPESGDY